MRMNEAMLDKRIHEAIEELIPLLLRDNLVAATAESLTGGMIASNFVDFPGSSRWFTHGFVTYSDEAKHSMLGVDAELIARETAVSRPVAARMAVGALRESGADFAVAVTGLAGPGKDELGRDAGLVYIGIAAKCGYAVREFHFSGERGEIRRKTVIEAVKMLTELVTLLK